MSVRATVSAPANIALIKYWGAKDPDRVVPYHPSISITLEVCRSVTTVEALPEGSQEPDEVWLERNGRLEPAAEEFARRVRGHLEVLRRQTGRGERFRVATRNTFPAAAGLASSASGFAALASAVVRALGISEDELEAHLGPGALSVLSRLSGSGSAARSVLGGYVEWPVPRDRTSDSTDGAGSTELAEDGDDLDGPARTLAPADHWHLADVIALIQSGPKEVSSLEGHRRAPTSPFFARRLELLPDRLAAVRQAIRDRDLDALGPVIERDAIELHAIAMTSEPPVFYWQPATLAVLEAVRQLRRSGARAWSTMDAGANVHVIADPEDEERVAERLAEVPGVRGVIRDRTGAGPRTEDEDLLEGVE